jgi:hypothetical protein
MFFQWKIFHNRLSLLFSGSGNNFDSNAAAAGLNAAPAGLNAAPGASAFNTGGFGGVTNSFGGTQANAMGNSGLSGVSGDGAFANQSGGVGNVQVIFNFGTSNSQEGNQ